MQYKPHEFAEMLGVTVKTLQRWDKQGILKAYRTPTNRRFYTPKQYSDYINSSSRENEVDGKKK
jgi:putative resolvase